MDFAQILEETTNHSPDYPAISASGHSLTYAELSHRVACLAGGFAAIRLAPGDRLATLLPNGIDLVVTLLAAARAELIAVPIPHRFAPAQIGYILRHSGARAIVTTPELLKNIPDESRPALDEIIVTGDVPETVSLAELLTAAPVPPVRTALDPIGLLMYTSGTTSRPKGVAHTQKRMSRRVDLFIEQMWLTGEDSTLSLVDVGRPIILLGQLLPMLRVGGRIALIPRPDPQLFWAEYAVSRPTYLISGPGMAFDLIDHPAARSADHSALRYWVTGGDKAPCTLHQRMTEVVGCPLIEMCGMTETGFYAVSPVAGPRKIGSIGRTMRGVAVRIVNPDGEDVLQGQVGHIVVRTPEMMVGYWNDTLQTHRVLRDGWLDTGDLVSTDVDGYLWFIGRDKDMISRGGMKVAPAMVEDAMLTHPAILGAAVVGVSDPRYGQTPFAFLPHPPWHDRSWNRGDSRLADDTDRCPIHPRSIRATGSLARHRSRQTRPLAAGVDGRSGRQRGVSTPKNQEHAASLAFCRRISNLLLSLSLLPLSLSAFFASLR